MLSCRTECPPRPFAHSQAGTLGVEVELMLLDAETLRPVPAAHLVLGQDLKPEIYQSMVEICTGVCGSLQEVEADLRRGFRHLRERAREAHLRVIGSGTHPIARFEEHVLTGQPRYHSLLERTQLITRRSTILGLHVHVGVSSGEHAIQLINELSPFLALFLALSASSPFMEGEDTGLASSRVTVYESHPGCGVPPSFTSWSEFEEHCARLERAGAMQSLKDLWWDIRPSPLYGTVEIRICDGQGRLEDTLALVAGVQCLVAWLEATRVSGAPAGPPAAWRLRENKWRAARYGLEAELIVNERGDTRPVRAIWAGLLRLLEPLACKLGCSRHLHRITHILESGASYHRQRRTLQQTGQLRKVVEALAEEWHGF
jgi:carboxylate-amine ligase